MDKSIKYLGSTPFGRRVRTGVQAKRIITTIPKEYAARLGIVEGLTDLEVTLQDGALVYRPIAREETRT